jgi:ribosomal protein S6--L-glutamate ligase
MTKNHRATDETLESDAIENRRGSEDFRSVVVFGKPTATNRALVTAFADLGHRARLAWGASIHDVAPGDVAIGRFDVLPTLDGVEPGLWLLSRLERVGVRVLNRPQALFAAHDKLTTALFLGRARVPQPRTAHVHDVSLPSFPPPYVVKPRFGSWGQEVHVSHDEDELRARLARLQDQKWFRRHGALVQSLVEPVGRDVRVIVAAGRVIGAIERRAIPGEWRTNVSLGAVRQVIDPPVMARALALRAVAALGLDFAGVDIAGHVTGPLRVIEINGAVDFTHEYGPNVFCEAAAALLRRAAVREVAPNAQRANGGVLNANRGTTPEHDACLGAIGPLRT